MPLKKEAPPAYDGFEQGPIRPPSEAESLLIRVTRNCPWNHCTFCPVYKSQRFSLRPVAHVIEDIEAVYRHVNRLRERVDADGRISQMDLNDLAGQVQAHDSDAFYAAVNWFAAGMHSIFLQDANSLIIKPQDLIRILEHLTRRFPWVARITSYARSHTVARISDAHLAAMQRAGLNRIHIGMESGADAVLAAVKKGATQAIHIKAGLKVKGAGMQLSEYVMPGLGGRALSRIHAQQTAEALNRIDPDFIRLRTLAIPANVPLYKAWVAQRFEKCGDVEMAGEVRTFIANLDGIQSTLVSDHILNLFEEVKGQLPDDKPRMLQVLDHFLALDPQSQCLYQVGRRLGIFRRLADIQQPRRTQRVSDFCRQHEITPQNVDQVVDELMTRFI